MTSRGRGTDQSLLARASKLRVMHTPRLRGKVWRCALCGLRDPSLSGGECERRLGVVGARDTLTEEDPTI